MDKTIASVNGVPIRLPEEIPGDDGFVITAFPTRRLNSLNRRQQEWP